MDPLALSRFQFGDTAAFHILWPLMSIGLSLYMLIMELLWLYTGDISYYRQIRFWLKIFVLTFAIGVGSGFPLSFQFGTNWAAFSKAAGSFFGNILGFETTVAFTLETASLGILVFGWKKVPKVVHVLANLGVLIGASLSAFWIMVANNWMQVPQGVTYIGGKFIVEDYALAIFNKSVIVSFSHMWLACIESTLFMMGGIAAWVLLANARRPKHSQADSTEKNQFFLNTLKYVLVIALMITPLQIFLGHESGDDIATHQPEKLAAVELHWETNAPGAGAPWKVVAWPNRDNTGNAFSVEVPNGLSLIATQSATGHVTGLNDFAPENRPTKIESIIVFYAFRLMVAIGIFLFFLVALSVWYWRKHQLTIETIGLHKMFLRLWIFSIPLGFIATEAGWMVREIGRQPWIVYHTMRTAEGLSSKLESPLITFTIAVITIAYLALFVLFIYFTHKIVTNGPDLTVTP